ncbi:leucoanthocyanidin reductase-like [Macadamia integrifolia]|uniref:leucoanthocyanidin reductase-like n=1 Tax=Macadamia integrifolia TaxID=60698 RepID=UPI001C4FCDD3|nr:leucoanthocyanidin reductase-like [Macadamia integrifolia]XP_042503246.1 leucoanthocyanidin reductase-like [Macadamia integrifolia]
MAIASAAQPVSAESTTLIVGATGFIGRFVAEACLETGRPTHVLVRSIKTTPSKSQTIKALQDKGAIVQQGSIKDREFMEKLLKEHKIEVVISAVGGDSILDQLSLIEAIKAVGTVKRFLPSEFGHDVERADPVEPGLSMYKEKRVVRRAIDEGLVPFTYICCNSVAAWPYHDNTHPSEVLPPLDRFQIYGDGSVKAYFVAGTDIGKFTMLAVDDERTLNKLVHFRPACNFLNINELAALWEKKLCRTLPRETITEAHLLAAAAENIIPESVVASFTHDIFIKGCQVNFSIDGQKDLEATSLYPDIPFRSIADCFDDFATLVATATAATATATATAAQQSQQPQKPHFQCQNSKVDGNTIEGKGDYTVNKNSMIFNSQPIET